MINLKRPKGIFYGVLAVLIILSPFKAAATTYYVSNAGSDSNSGRDTSHTWAHIPGGTGCANNCASVTLASGDIVSLNKGDTWSSTTVTIKASGTSSSPITFNSYGVGAKPIISSVATSPVITWGSERNYITIDALDLRAPRDSGQGIWAIYIAYFPDGDYGQSIGWTVKNCDINAGILLTGPNTLVQNNTLNGGGLDMGGQGAITLRGSHATSGVIEGNTVHDFKGKGIDVCRGASNINIRNNLVYNISTGTDGWGYGINADGNDVSVSGIQIYNNITYNMTGTISMGILLETAFTSSVYNNLIHDIEQSCGIGSNVNVGHLGQTQSGSIHHNVIYNVLNGICFWQGVSWGIYNNTMYASAGTTGLSFWDNSTNTSAITFTNNIIGGVWANPIYVPDNKAIWTQLDYNDIVSTGTTVLYQAIGGAKTLANLQALGLMTHGITSSPLLTNGSGSYSLAGDFTLQSNSPCIYSGVNVGLTADYVGKALHNPPSMGAYEYIEETVPTAPRSLRIVAQY